MNIKESLCKFFGSSFLSSSCRYQKEVSMVDGVDLIKKYEGFRNTAYKCPAGVWTIGYGSTMYADGTPVKKGDIISEQTAEALLIDYLNKNVRPHLDELGQLKQCQIYALESLIYNIGWSSFVRSKCCKAIKDKDWPTVFHNWDWMSGGGKFLPGLAKRRTEELYIFFQGL